jgi:sugar phosphate isomerase/epimerase
MPDHQPVVSLSSCWNSHRHTDGYEMAQEIAALGFPFMELSHGIRLSLVPGILKAVDEGLIRVSSVHNFCPLPPGVVGAAPNLYEPTGRSRQESSLWFRHTLKTLDFARRVGATLMVCHSGSVRFWWRNPELRLDQYREGKDAASLEADAHYRQLRERCLKRLRGKQQAAFRHMVDSYRRIGPLALERGVRIGIENRDGFVELPLDDEMPDLLATLGAPEVFGYWHDSGHAQLKEQLGVITHRHLLERNAERQFGFHLHDVSEEEKDHQPLGTGIIDWPMVRSFVRPHHLLVLELHPRTRARSVSASLNFVHSLINP